ncbi:hypothetical protein ACFY2M_28475 [Streptomyces sp. NPDC001276]|uniref:hypothetical protein n=1 Tax=Streptomyces sp. NPDC001276 TaxID=3364555 RepID=UPI0036C1E600
MGTHGNAPSGSVLRGNVAFAFRGNAGRLLRFLGGTRHDESYERLYLVMKLADGIPFGDYVNPAKPLPVSWAAAVTAQV